MLQRSLRRGGRMQHYYVSPVRYSLSAGGDDAEAWAARMVGFLYVVVGALLFVMPLLPTRSFVGGLIIALLMPAYGVLGLVTVLPSNAGPWLWLSLAAAFSAVGIGILRGWRIAHFAGIALALAIFAPALWAGPVAGGVLVIVLWRGQKALVARTNTSSMP